MFSPSTADGGPATATRSRRRQRPLSSESHPQQPKAKRQRLPLTESTFINPDAPADQDALTFKPAKIPEVVDIRNENVENIHHTPRKDVNVRAKKTKHGDRAANKGDGSLVLTSTNAYTVSKLPALPDRLRSEPAVEQYGEIFSTSGYALTLTPTLALVWPYTSTSQSPETFTFTLPATSRSGDPLPVGCLVSPSVSSTEPGLVVVMAGTGQVVYWESISSAATFAFIKKDRSGVEYTISGMSSGEKVVAITNAETAGFVLTFNSGRLAYLNVRDSHGRPSISVQFLRTAVAATGSGIFGSIRHAFSHLSLRGDIAAVRADRSARVGERNIVALGTKGKLQAWKITRGGHNEPLGEAEMKDSIVAALREADPVCKQFSADSFEALDLTFVPKGLEPKYLELSRLSDAMATDDSNLQHLLLLVSLTRKNTSRYALVEVILTPRGCQTGFIRPITSYSTPHSQPDASGSVRPRVYLPRPALVAFVVFEHAAIMASVAVPPDSPDSQLQSDNHILPATFEDVVDFRDDTSHDIVGSGFEEIASVTASEESRTPRNKSRNPAAVLLVRGAGVVRFITTDVDKFASEQPPVVSAKSKLEQAVFYGAKLENPLVFDARQEIVFSSEETCQAALDVSQEILSSTTGFISTLPAHLEENLRARSSALERLVSHFNNINAELDRHTRWELLFNAEKMHVAIALWKLHEQFTSARPADNKKSLIGSIVEFIHQDQKHNPAPNIGEVDRVRHWFINDVFRQELFVAWAYEVIKVLYKDRLLDDAQVTVMLAEAVQINIIAHRSALEFRRNNLAFYGLGNEELRGGILVNGYEDLPEPWTGCHFIANNAKRLAELAMQWVENHREAESKPRTATTPDPKIVSKVSKDLPSLVDGMLSSVLEQARWSSTQSSPDQKRMGQEFVKVFHEDRYKKPIALAHTGYWDQASRIAEKYDCLSGLAVILLDHVEDLELELTKTGLAPEKRQSLRAQRESKKTELESSLTNNDEGFAFPLYEYLLEKHGIAAVLQFDLDKHGFKTKFLRSKPELAKISWINDIQQEKDVHHAAETLVDLALMKEQQVWSKKIELSLGKLALLAEAEEKSESLQVKADEDRREAVLSKVDKELVAIKIQDQLYNQISPTTFDAVDEAAALNIAMEVHATNVPKRFKAQKAQYQVLEDGVKRLLQHEALDAMTLIDLLTLLTLPQENREFLVCSQFWMACKVADSCCHSDEKREAKRLIWRRLLNRDDWSKINDTQLKGDDEVTERIMETELFEMLADCIRYQDERDPFKPMAPRDALGAFTENLDRRFRDFDADFQSRLKDAMKAEDKTLTQHLEKHRLAEWLRTTMEAAEVEIQHDIDEATKAGAQTQQQQQQPEPEPGSLVASALNMGNMADRPLFGSA